MAADHKGFTLLEVLVALAVGSLVLLAVTTTLFSLNRAHQQVSERMEQQRSLRNTVDLLRRELSSAIFRPNDKLLRFQVQDRDFYGKPASTLQLATLSAPLDSAASDQQVVLYQPEQQQEHIRLTRASRDYFQADSIKPNPYPLLEQLDGFLVECYDGSKWVKTWDSELNRSLPKQVRITVILPDSPQPVSFQLLASPRIEQQ